MVNFYEGIIFFINSFNLFFPFEFIFVDRFFVFVMHFDECICIHVLIKDYYCIIYRWCLLRKQIKIKENIRIFDEHYH